MPSKRIDIARIHPARRVSKHHSMVLGMRVFDGILISQALNCKQAAGACAPFAFLQAEIFYGK